jgi:dTMP kinase
MAKFIVFEGIDGCGKTSQILHTINFLKDFKPIFLSKEPSTLKTGKLIKKLLKEQTDPKSNAELFTKLYRKDREEHNKLIKHQLNLGNIVILDRYYYSSIAYQQAQGTDVKKILKQSKKFIAPDLTIILDIPAKTAVQRLKARGSKEEKFEKLKFLEELREIYLKMPFYGEKFLDKGSSKKENIKIIDGSRTPEKVFEEIKEELKKL